LVMAGGPTVFDILKLDVSKGSVANLDSTGIAVYKNVAKDKHWTIGSTVPAVFTKTGRQSMHLAAIYDDNAQVGSYFIGSSAWSANFTSTLDNRVLVKSRSGVSTSAATAAVKTVTQDYPGVKVLDRAAYKSSQVQIFNQLLGLVYALLALAILIALLGIANTLALSIGERIREVGLLRAVGMTRAQLRSTIRWEAVVIALQGTALGLVIGVFFGWALTAAMHDQGVTELHVPGLNLLAIVLLAALAGMLAAVGPSRRAAKLDILRAIVSE
jgi:putative ABC transport system permease protein